MCPHTTKHASQVSYAPNGSMAVTGGEESKVKVFDVYIHTYMRSMYTYMHAYNWRRG